MPANNSDLKAYRLALHGIVPLGLPKMMRFHYENDCNFSLLLAAKLCICVVCDYTQCMTL